MTNTMKMFAVAVVAAIAVFFIMNDSNDFGDNVEEAVNDAGREIEDATEG